MVMYHSNGSIKFDDLYNMPVYLRNFYIRQLEDIKTKEAEVYSSAQKKTRPSKR